MWVQERHVMIRHKDANYYLCMICCTILFAFNKLVTNTIPKLIKLNFWILHHSNHICHQVNIVNNMIGHYMLVISQHLQLGLTNHH